jgi:hypothetical protein
MNQHGKKQHGPDPAALARESRRRLRRGKAWILISNALAFMLVMAVVVFAL